MSLFRLFLPAANETFKKSTVITFGKAFLLTAWYLPFLLKGRI